ncbi:UPF0187-domain-containing protein [Basidiobolus meristosporus CBS 931.73]|uniref:UPF0187-domain-containing protein n=1 Tax=Basidiobolus meristosporus CBS 931.73 TaxID=1314790 RepID=A0A1Y1YWG4_9FUNG|nr:UPF0187-domain-containing protein [Basidiobolus meristosporus CBS 931.73]|eukprot:ORY02408.1 UPF0187-domain-containing protein [Basidiobolus meristosporus CBS 931.73]
MSTFEPFESLETLGLLDSTSVRKIRRVLSRETPDVFTYKGTALQTISKHVSFYVLYTVLLASGYGKRRLLPTFSNSVTSVLSSVTGLLLAFRMNNAYDKYSEGRKLWCNLSLSVRNFTRYVWVHVQPEAEAKGPERSAVHKHKIVLLRLAVAYMLAVKYQLREEEGLEMAEVHKALPKKFVESLRQQEHPSWEENGPLRIAQMLDTYLEHLKRQRLLDAGQFNVLVNYVNTWIEIFTNLERILTTPIPLSYHMHLKQIITLYCLALPPTLIDQLGYWAVPVMAVASFTFFGIEQISSEIENPFGQDENDLKVDEFCDDMKYEVEAMVSRKNMNPDKWVD